MPAPTASTLIDAVDQDNAPVGTVARSEAFRVGANFRTVHVLVYNGQGDLLLQQLGRVRDRNPLRWGSSVAGYLFAGEDYGQGAARRIREELGIAPDLEWVGVTPMRDEGVTKFIGVYTARAESATVAAPGHIERLEWWSPGALRDSVHGNAVLFTASFLHVLDFAGGADIP